MRNRLLLFLAGCALSFGFACSHQAGTAAKKPNPAPAVAATPSEGARLTAVKSELAPEARLIATTSGRPSFVSYSPQPDVFVLDFAKTVKQPDLTIPSNLPPFVGSVAADEAVEAGTQLTRVTVRFTQAMTARAAATDEGVVVTYEPVITTTENVVPLSAVPVVEEVAVTEPAVQVTVAEPALPPDAKPAKNLKGVRTSGSGLTLQIMLDADGALSYKAFRLTNPLRVVIDLEGVRNRVRKSTIDLGDPFVKRIRISQFQSTPAVARIVLDMDELVEYRVERLSDGARVAFGEPPAVAEPVAVEPVAVAAGSNGTHSVEPGPMQGASDVATDMAPAPQVTPSPIPVTTRAQTVQGTATTQTTARTTTAPVEDVFVEPQQGQTGMTGGVLRPGERRDISGQERVYTGEPITLTLKDADIKDVLRTFAQLTGLNIAIDPQVSGTVTVEFDNVPWDQALELILRQNGLTYVLTGNVMRVGTVERLAREQQQTRQLEEEERLNVPLQTIIRRLSYAKADDVQKLATQLASPRGRIIVDPRTNQLIITDVPQYIPTILSLIENVDIPTPQVVIEARIVETTKDFSRQLGVRWNFAGSLDPNLGTGTGLVFPNRVGIIGGPFNFAANAPDVLRFTLSDVLGAFDLDIALTAAEREGLARVVSAPKVTTQDNQPAEIESGVQIPVQTRINFTTTTNYVNATLRLEVTPQITAVDTVIMQINVIRTTPGEVVEGAQGPPLRTRRAATRVMVRDGGTTVIGGIYQANDSNTEQRVPFVHQIPIIGNLFRSRSFTIVHDELLIFITPRIVRNA